MQRIITLNINCKDEYGIDNDVICVVQNYTIIYQIKLKSNKIVKTTFNANPDEKVYLCFLYGNLDDYREECRESKFVNLHKWGKYLLFSDLTFSRKSTIGFVKNMYSNCTFYELATDEETDITLKFHCDENNGLRTLVYSKDDLLIPHYIKTNLNNDYRHLLTGYLFHIFKVLFLNVGLILYAYAYGMSLLYPICGIAILLQVISISRIPIRVTREYRKIKNMANSETIKKAIMDDVLYETVNHRKREWMPLS